MFQTLLGRNRGQVGDRPVPLSELDPEKVERLAAKAQALAENWDRPADAPDPDDARGATE